MNQVGNETIENDNDYDGNDRKYDDDRKYVDDNDETKYENDVEDSAKYDADDCNVRIV